MKRILCQYCGVLCEFFEAWDHNLYHGLNDEKKNPELVTKYAALSTWCEARGPLTQDKINEYLRKNK
jgi:hypothetical protein